MYKVFGVSQQHGKLNDGNEWTNYHLYCLTDIVDFPNMETIMKGFKTADIKVSKSIVDSLGYPVTDLVGKEVRFNYTARKSKDGLQAILVGIELVKNG